MRRSSLLTQVVLVNLLLIGAGAIAAVVATIDTDLRESGGLGLVLGFALATTIVVNLFLLSTRIRPLELLADEMERTSLSSAMSAPAASVGGATEVRRLEAAFRRMIIRLEAERQRATHSALDAQERERARVARDLHDEVNQSLTGLLLRLGAISPRVPDELRAEIEETREVAAQAMRELLALARQLRPTALDDLGLTAALDGLISERGAHSGIAAEFKVSGELCELSEETQLVVYRVAQEAISNAIQHSHAANIEVSLGRAGTQLELVVSDDGHGFDWPRARAGLGLAGMRERALLVGGQLEIDSAKGRGTGLTLRVPCGARSGAGTEAAERSDAGYGALEPIGVQ